MSWVIILLLVAAVLAIVLAIYVGSRYRILPDRKPALCWFPKYRFSVDLPPVVTGREQPLDAVAERMETLGFQLKKADDAGALFSRGSIAGDISIEIVKVNVRFPLPLAPTPEVRAGYAFAFFDTGDLWAFCQELKSTLQDHGAPA